MAYMVMAYIGMAYIVMASKICRRVPPPMTGTHAHKAVPSADDCAMHRHDYRLAAPLDRRDPLLRHFFLTQGGARPW